ncbi:MAG: NAD(P)/FAD-dependent oxidoreductase [Rhizobiaceae bacterium]
MKRIAIIGAGIGGIALAHALSGGAQVTVFEKGRGVGGRMATRREGDHAFDHGAQCFTVRTPQFESWLAPLREQGLVAEWSGRVVNLSAGRITGPRHWRERHLVGVPGMNAIARHLAAGLDVRSNVEIAPIAAAAGTVPLASIAGESLGAFDLVVSTTTPHQTRALFADLPAIASLEQPRMKPCHALMLALEGPWPQDWIAAKIMDGPVKWVSVDSSKPGRDASKARLVAHTRSGWSRHHADTPARLLEPILVDALANAMPFPLPRPALVKAHRWRSALVSRTQRSGPMLDPALGVAATGDWAASSRIEEAVLSALELARRIEET